jgi:rsbT co-antagonist protein RsbR
MHHDTDALLTRFFDRNTVPLALLDRGGNLIRVNDAWRRQNGPGTNGSSFFDLLISTDVEATKRVLDGLTSSIRVDVTFGGEHERRTRLQATLDEEANTILVVDIETPEPLRDESAKNRLLLETFSHVVNSVPVVLWSADAKGVISLQEGRGLASLGMTSGQLVGVSIFDAFKDFTPVLDGVRRAIGGEVSRRIDSFPGDQHFDSWILPMKSEGTVHGVIGLAIDATDKVRKERELAEKLELIRSQSETIRALATPIIEIWKGVLCLPVIGTVDSQRASEMMQSLLEAIVKEQSSYAIVDLTGVEVVDTSTADHVLRLFRAAKALGVDGILCGIRPAVAQTVVSLGVDLASIRTMRTLREALTWCIDAREAAPTPRRAS